MSHVVFYEPYAMSPQIWGVSLETMQRLLDAGTRVTFIGCDSELSACAYNLYHRRVNCQRCVFKRHRGLGALKGEGVNYLSLTRLHANDKRLLAGVKTEFTNVNELKRYQFEGFDLGMAVASTIISVFRNKSPDVSGSLSTLTRNLVISCATIFLSLRNHLKELSPDRVYTYNGRLDGTRPLVRAAQKASVPFSLCESGATYRKYDIYEDMIPHHMDAMQSLINKMWNSEDTAATEAAANSYYHERRYGVPDYGPVYTGRQVAGQLPDGFSPDNHNVVFFTSSDDEFAAIDTGESVGLFTEQPNAFMAVLGICEKIEGCHVYLRIHPNVARSHRSSLDPWLAFDSPVLTTILPESPVDTYGLMDAANKIVTFGSTMGIEAAYWGKPSVLVGRSFYSELGSVYRPSTREELELLLMQNDLPARPIEGALKYGGYIATHGEYYRYYRPIDFTGGHFNGIRLSPRFSGIERLLFYSSLPHLFLKLLPQSLRTPGDIRHGESLINRNALI